MTTTPFTGHRWPPPPTSGEADTLHDVIHSRKWIDGPWTRTAEQHLTTLTGAPHAVAFNSCTSAIHAALHALGATPITRVTTAAFGFAGTLTGARHIGAQLHYADVHPDTLTLTPTPDDEHTILLPVDTHGVPHTLDRTNPRLITDACQSLGTLHNGRHVGAEGIHAWSFSSSKLIAAPDGGAITTDSHHLAETLRQLRDYGIATDHRTGRANAPVTHPGGHNWRPSELTMALVAHRLNRATDYANRARRAARILHNAIDAAGLWRQSAPTNADPAWHKIRIGPHHPAPLFPLENALNDAGLPTHRWGSTLLPDHPAFAPRAPIHTPHARAAANTTLCLGTETCPPMTWTDDELAQACHIIENLTDKALTA